MNIGLLNEKVTFQKNELIVDKIGNHRNAWVDFYRFALRRLAVKGWQAPRKRKRQE